MRSTWKGFPALKKNSGNHYNCFLHSTYVYINVVVYFQCKVRHCNDNFFAGYTTSFSYLNNWSEMDTCKMCLVTSCLFQVIGTLMLLLEIAWRNVFSKEEYLTTTILNGKLSLYTAACFVCWINFVLSQSDFCKTCWTQFN